MNQESSFVPEPSHPTRNLLLEKGLALAESGSLAATSVDDVVRAAGVSKGTFYVHFKDRATYLAALHRNFYDMLGVRIRESMAPLVPGAARLRRGAEVYLDGCLHSRGVKAMLVDVRSEPAITAQIRENSAGFASLIVEDFTALKVAEPAAAARLFIAMVQEVALGELDRGGPDRKLRRALWHLGGVSD
jgi:TetR/AcrR family transcriptional regulator, transcriptional repressor for nem operon